MNKILIQVDDSCDMAAVSLNGDCILEGNFWDFHAHSNEFYDKYGEFKGYKELSRIIRDTLLKAGEKVEIVTETYKYEY